MNVETFRTDYETKDGRTFITVRRIREDGVKTGEVQGPLSIEEKNEMMAWLDDPTLPQPAFLKD